MRRRAPRFGASLLLPSLLVLVLGVAAGAPTEVAGQARGSGAAAGADTLTVEQRLAERLRLLDRAPGVDSANISADSARLAVRATRAAEQTVTLPGADSIMLALLELEGYEVTQYAGTEATWDARRSRLFLVGDSTQAAQTLMSDGTRMESDTIDYDQESGDVLFRGGEAIIVPSTGEPLTAQIAKFNTDTEIGAARDARTRVTEGGEWNIRGDLREISAGRTFGSHLMFTSCDEEEPHYHFQAEEYKWTSGGTIVARNVRLYFADVPVFWLPFIAQNTQSERSSGILAPRFSVNDIVRSSGGYRRRVSNVGYYWAINDYSDATLAFDWFDENFTALTGSVRYRWLRQFLEGSLDFRQFWRANGGTETTLNTRHQWQISERTSFRGRMSFASSSEFIANNSFNPAEVTQSVDSEGGLNHRFDWGNLQLSANRRQFLNDDRVEQTLPNGSLSVATVTLLPAPASQARWYNNMTLAGSTRLQLTTSDFGLDSTRNNTGNMRLGVNSSLNLGNLQLTGNVNYERSDAFDVALDSAAFFAGDVAEQGLAAFWTPAWARHLGLEEDSVRIVDTRQENIRWSGSLNYQKRLIGTTTFTPRIQFSGRQRRSNTIENAQSFVAAPSQLSFGAQLNADLFGFFPGFGGYERVRHKITPSMSYDWSPEIEPNELQEQVFGSRNLQPRNVLTVGLNQTFEAKRRPPGPDAEAGAGDDPDPALGEAGSVDVAALADSVDAAAADPVDPDEPRRLEQGEVVNLLSVNTRALTYDFVNPDSLPRSFIDGFTTTTLDNTISSDFLRGLQIQMAHDLFEDVQVGDDPAQTERRFSPRLARLNLNFQLSNRSSIFRLLGLAGRGEGDEDERDEDELFEEEEGDFLEDDVLGLAGADETSMLPGNRTVGNRRSSSSGIGEWSANLGYSMNRAAESSSLRAQLRLQPTEMWEMSWNTSYDFSNSRFNDHTIRLSRDLHRWRANFDLVQAVNGNWVFRFEVSLIDNRDLNFDYEQRNNVLNRSRR